MTSETVWVITVFLSTLSLRRATSQTRTTAQTTKFLSTLSLRRATKAVFWQCASRLYFYPRSPCGERPNIFGGVSLCIAYFYPRSPCGERQRSMATETIRKLFLSTLSLRRATVTFLFYNNRRQDFYPRSPCGERRLDNVSAPNRPISIHALLAESDHTL